MIRFQCECGRQVQADRGSVGMLAQCPLCQQTTTVPATDESAIDVAPANDGEQDTTITRLDQTSAPPARPLPEEPDEDAPPRPPVRNPFAQQKSSDAEAAFTLGLIGGPFLCLPSISGSRH